MLQRCLNGFFACLLSLTLIACAEFKSAGKTIGTASKEAAIEIGNGTKRVVNDIKD